MVNLIKRKNIRLLTADMSVSQDFAEALDKHTEGVLIKAISRAKENQRKTVMPRDL